MANRRPVLSQDLLKDIFEYDGQHLRWRYSRGSRAPKGSVAGSKTKHGYWCVRVNDTLYQAHRLIFEYVHGWCPENIDHVDGDRVNNRIENLRPATVSQNRMNEGLRERNSSGIKGVSFDKAYGKWCARVTVDRKTTRKFFDRKQDAADWVSKKRDELHGEFSCHGRVLQ